MDAGGAELVRRVACWDDRGICFQTSGFHAKILLGAFPFYIGIMIFKTS